MKRPSHKVSRSMAAINFRQRRVVSVTTAHSNFANDVETAVKNYVSEIEPRNKNGKLLKRLHSEFNNPNLSDGEEMIITNSAIKEVDSEEEGG